MKDLAFNVAVGTRLNVSAHRRSSTLLQLARSAMHIPWHPMRLRVRGKVHRHHSPHRAFHAPLPYGPTSTYQSLPPAQLG
jgi:hypothetical protein